MISLTYVSSATELLDASRLQEMLRAWRATNAAHGLTGMLLYSGGNVIQTLEGRAEDVDAMFDTIDGDPRHKGVLVLLREPLIARAFPDWSMGFRYLSREEMRDTDGFNPFLQQSTRGDQEESTSSAQHLLKVFRANMR